MNLKKLKDSIKSSFKGVYISSVFLFVISIICFIVIGYSIFIPGLDATGNLVTIRTLFSSVIGFILETSTRKFSCNDSFIKLKNYFIGSLAILIIVLIALATVFSINVNNPSLILLKNLAFSCVGFLISATKDCE